VSDRSLIEWTDASWTPSTGCVEVSPGCAHCCARTFAERFRGVAGDHFEQGFDVRLWPERLELPLRWRGPRRIFVNSMSDLGDALRGSLTTADVARDTSSGPTQLGRVDG
jgi:protein gp37